MIRFIFAYLLFWRKRPFCNAYARVFSFKFLWGVNPTPASVLAANAAVNDMRLWTFSEKWKRAIRPGLPASANEVGEG
jgi:hypothetical protein